MGKQLEMTIPYVIRAAENNVRPLDFYSGH